MQSSEIVIGHRYGMRLKAAVGEPLIDVKVVEKSAARVTSRFCISGGIVVSLDGAQDALWISVFPNEEGPSYQTHR
jgi:hypothetical protein